MAAKTTNTDKPTKTTKKTTTKVTTKSAAKKETSTTKSATKKTTAATKSTTKKEPVADKTSKPSKKVQSLLIVESPAKSKTLTKYLGPGFKVLASYGHVRDLVPKEGAVDTEHQFKMRYEPIERNIKHVENIIASLKGAERLYLATDPDREGEAIAWHLYEILKERNALKDKEVFRVVFNEITKTAVNYAIEHPRQLAMPLINAQQARRALDYLVGFNLSPLLWKKIRRGLSAGRVQSPALRLIVERELEIEAFNSQEYWTIAALATHKKLPFSAKLTEYQGDKITQFSVTNTEQATEMRELLLKTANGQLLVKKVERKQRKRNPAAPFITSTLQQEAARKLGFTAQRTMRTAQQLYEGIDIGEGAIGLITYMRTDSVNLAQEALTEIRATIEEKYGKAALPAEPRMYRTKAKNAQEAHEAIRPTSAAIAPESIKDKLSDEQYKLYSLIYKRTLASQMISATIDTVAIDFSSGEKNSWRANGSTIVDPGFLSVYEEGVDDQKKDDDNSESPLPPFNEGDVVKLEDVETKQHFTEPPPRYSEASLVKALEEFGIGRPSTYASIISTLQQREYVELESKRFYPTDVGRIVNKFLTEYFTNYVDYDFTAKMEDELDAISRHEKEWVPVLEEFWLPFHTQVQTINDTVKRSDVTQEQIDEKCPKCGSPLSIRLGRRGRFIGCTTYPECDYTRSLNEDAEEAAQPSVVEGRTCPDCGSPLIVRTGRFGKFIGCSNYPKCKHIEPMQQPKSTSVLCPNCHQGNMLQRRSRRGKIFYSCSRYPDCDYAIWNEPVAKVCPECKWPIMTIKVTKRHGQQLVCPQKNCGHTEPYTPPEEQE
ncbi:MAG: type I DNA topoisomerase [Gammaproteobacteria bacterium]